MQHFLNFLPLPHGQGSFRPTFGPACFGLGGLRSRVTSEISSGLSGSIPIIAVQPLSSRGMGKPEIVKIADLIDAAMINHENKDVLDRVSKEVLELCKKFPVYS